MKHFPIRPDMPLLPIPASPRGSFWRVVYSLVDDFLLIRLIIVQFCLSSPNMDSDHIHPLIDGGHAGERQPLLPSPLSTNDHSDIDTVVDAEGAAVDDSGTNVLLHFRTKLVASALNFFLSGIAMAAVGVSINLYTCSLEAR